MTWCLIDTKKVTKVCISKKWPHNHTDGRPFKRKKASYCQHNDNWGTSIIKAKERLKESVGQRPQMLGP